MDQLRARIKNYLYDSREKFLSVLRWFTGINSLLAIFLLLLRYGFILDDYEIHTIFIFVDVVFGVYGGVFLMKFILSNDKTIDFLRENRFEVIMISVALFHGLVNFFFDFKILLYYTELLSFKRPELSYQHILSVYLFVLIGYEITKVTTRLPDINLKPATIFLFSFILLILGGTFLLMMPAMSPGKESVPFIDALFISTSASCVTGLSTLDTANDFTFKGHLVIMFLFQIGGLGIVVFITFFASFLASGVGLKHQSIIQDHLSSESLIGATKMLRKIIFITLIIELAGAVGIYFSIEDDLWDEEHQIDLGDKIFLSVFHSISAFCNAGFSLFSGGLADEEFDMHRMYTLHFVVAIIIVLGGIGFTTIEDVLSPKNIRERIKKPWKDWEIGTKLAVHVSWILIAIGTLIFMLLEFDKLRDRTIVEAFITALFQSVTTRTAGFNTVSIADLKVPTIIMFIMLMFIGTAPGSTGGGIKITTFMLIFKASVASITRQERIEFANRTIPYELVRKAISIFIFAVSYNAIAIFLLSIVETPQAQDQNFVLKLIFEQVSAFATVGISMNYTSELSYWGKIIIITSMYLGRVGTLTLALALSDSVVSNSYKYPEAHIMVG